MVLTCRCGGRILEDDGELVCTRCGEVRRAAPTLTQIWSEMGRTKTFEGKWRLRKLDRKISRPNGAIIGVIESICTKCGVPDIAYRRAVSLNTNANAHGLNRGWHRGALAAALVTLACRLEGVPRTTKSVCEVAAVKPGQVKRIYGVLVNGLSLSVPPPDPAAFISSIATSCKVPETILRKAVELLQSVMSQMSGKDPATLAAAALYTVCAAHNCGITQQEIADAAAVSTVSVRLRRQDLARVINNDVA